MLISQKSSVGFSLIMVSALTRLTGWQEGHQTHKIIFATCPQRVLVWYKWRENRRETGKTRFIWKTATEIELVVVWTLSKKISEKKHLCYSTLCPAPPTLITSVGSHAAIHLRTASVSWERVVTTTRSAGSGSFLSKPKQPSAYTFDW